MFDLNSPASYYNYVSATLCTLPLPACVSGTVPNHFDSDAKSCLVTWPVGNVAGLRHLLAIQSGSSTDNEAFAKTLPDTSVEPPALGLTKYACDLMLQIAEAIKGPSFASSLDSPSDRRPIRKCAERIFAAAEADENRRIHIKPLPKGSKRTKPSKRNRDKRKGLPSDDALRSLARMYLTCQRQHFPKLADTGYLPSPDNESAVTEMVEQFKSRHVTGKVAEIPPLVRKSLANLAAAYCRYSCDNSKITSIEDQLRKELGKAKEKGDFIPWVWVFADYAVSGLNDDRTDYINLKKALAVDPLMCSRVYIDDFTRASRDTLEWWRLAAFLVKRKVNMIGASDGFELDKESSLAEIALYSLLSALFLKSLRQKVRRGRAGAIERGTSIGRPAFGYALSPLIDLNGNEVISSDGQTVMVDTPDPDTAPWVQRAFEMYADERLSTSAIARLFNEQKVDGRDWWTPGVIAKIIRRSKYIGIGVYGKTRIVPSVEGGSVVEKVPRREWQIKSQKNLIIVPKELWKRANKRFKRQRKINRLTGRTPTRNQRFATTLFSGTLFCPCGRELMLSHSDEKYRSFCCPSGIGHRDGCRMILHKSAKIIETSLLEFINERLLSNDFVEELVKNANVALEKLKSIEPDDVRPLKQEKSALERKIKILEKRMADIEDDDLYAALSKNWSLLKKQKAQLGVKIDSLDRHWKVRTLPPITRDHVLAHLNDVRELLVDTAVPANRHLIPRAAEAIRNLLGKVTISAQPRLGTARSDWTATFTPSTTELLPPGTFVEGVQIPEQVIKLDVPKAVRAADRVKALIDKSIASGGKRPTTAAMCTALGMSVTLVEDAELYLKKGVVRRRPLKSRKGYARQTRGEPKYIALASEVKRLADEENRPMKAIAKSLGMTPSTAIRAYHYNSRETINDTLKSGERIYHCPPTNLTREQQIQVRNLRASGMTQKAIAAKFSVGPKVIWLCLARASAKAKLVATPMQAAAATTAKRPAPPPRMAPSAQVAKSAMPMPPAKGVTARPAAIQVLVATPLPAAAATTLKRPAPPPRAVASAQVVKSAVPMPAAGVAAARPVAIGPPIARPMPPAISVAR